MFKKIFDSMLRWLMAHPVMEHLLEALLFAEAGAIYQYLKAGIMDPTHVISWGGFSMVVTLTMKAWIGLNKTQILAQAQDVIQALQSASPSTPVSQVVNNVPVPKGAALSAIIRPSAIMIFFLLMAGPSFAGYQISRPKSDNVGLTLPSGTAIYLMPIEGFNVGANLPNPTYGISLNEDLVFADETVINGKTNLSPIFGLGASLYADIAGVINNNGPLYLLAGANVIGPDLDLFGLGNGQGLVPQAMVTYNFETKETKVTGGLTVFTDLGPGTAKKLTR